jgi:hypothetical protein
MIEQGWKKCGLRAPFDETKDSVLIKAQLAMSDSDHPLYPLVPIGDRTSLPPEVIQGKTEPEIGQAGELRDDDAALHVEADEEDQQAAQRVRALAAANETGQVQRTSAQPVCSGNAALLPTLQQSSSNIADSRLSSCSIWPHLKWWCKIWMWCNIWREQRLMVQ